MSKKLTKFVIILLVSAFTSVSFAAPDSFKDIVDEVNPAVVYIEISKEVQNRFNFWGQPSEPQDVTGSGSGVIIDADKGYVLTAAHVIKDIDEATINLQDGRKFEAAELLFDEQTDVGLVKLEIPEGEQLPEASLGDSEQLKVGDWVLAMGSPLGKALANSVSAGIVSGKSRKSGILGKLGIEDFIQTDAVINKGNSGGPLVNTKGEIVGINSNIISATGLSSGLGFAVPSNLAKNVVEKLITEGKVVRGYLGVSVTSLDALKDDVLEDIPEDVIEKGGAYIVEVVEDGPADEAGVKDGDVITKVDNIEITNSSELIKYISSIMPDETVICHINREGERIKKKVKLGIRPGTGGDTTVTSRDKDTPAYKKLGIVIDDYRQQQKRMPGIAAVLEGVEIRTVTEGSIAEEFGLASGDVIVEVDDERVKNSSQFNEKIENADLDEGVLLNVKSGEKLKKVFIKTFD